MCASWKPACNSRIHHTNASLWIFSFYFSFVLANVARAMLCNFRSNNSFASNFFFSCVLSCLFGCLPLFFSCFPLLVFCRAIPFPCDRIPCLFGKMYIRPCSAYERKRKNSTSRTTVIKRNQWNECENLIQSCDFFC